MVLLSESMHTIVKTHSKLIYKLHFHSKIMFLAENDVDWFQSEAHAMCWFTCLKSGIDNCNFTNYTTTITELTSCYT